MHYHNITTDDMLNGDGLRVVLWVAGCEHHCKGCHNPITWDADGGLQFDDKTKDELFDLLAQDHISGLTLSGGDPLAYKNVIPVGMLVKEVKDLYPNKTIWVYTGYTWEDIMRNHYCRYYLLPYVDVVVDGEYVQELRDTSLKWRGSSNQRVIDVQKSLEQEKVVLLVED